MLIDASERGFGAAAADVAVLLTERGLGGNDPDLELRWRRWRSDRSPRARGGAENGRSDCAVNRLRSPREETIWPRRLPSPFPTASRAAAIDPAKAGSRSADAASGSIRLRRWQRSQWLAVGEVAGHASGARILSAAAIDEQDVLDLFGDRIETRHDGDFDPVTGSVTPTRSRRLGAIRLSSGPDPNPDEEAIEQALLDGVREHGLDLLPWDERGRQLRHRAAFAHPFDQSICALDDEGPARARRRMAFTAALGKAPPRRYRGRLRSRARLRHCSATTRSGSSTALRRPSSSARPAAATPSTIPRRAARPSRSARRPCSVLQQHPTIANGKVPLILAITSPAGRPIQTTKDLPGFWAGSWRDVAKDMRGRYPKHPWPDDPASAVPTLRTKRAS